MSIEEGVEKIIAELAVIKGAPIISIAALIVVIIAVWAIVNFAYRAVFSSKNSQIELLNAQVADYKDKLNGASADQVKARIEALEQQVRSIRPRILTDEQKRVIAEQARLPQGMSASLVVMNEMQCSDCSPYAAEFRAAFSHVPNWSVGSGMIMNATNADPSGVTVLIKDAANPTIKDVALIRALQAAQIRFGTVQEAVGNADMRLLITAKIER